ncbi:metallophosphoesterase family protein [Pseudomonas fluorescens]|uniref:metallophosphoesterase family protein n=1 Tax=Pseudomonas fluorescens TaxID=294 RepID=UPI003747E9ED
MIGIISDIHGNHVALEAVLSRLDELGVSQVICLGDVGGYYCEINECCETLQKRQIFTLMGNHDWYLATGESCPRSNSVNVCLNYQRSVINAQNKQWLASLKPQATIGALDIVHGGWNDPLDEYMVPSESYFSHRDGTLFASGHTHVPCVWKGRHKSYCNPGSVGQPRDGDPRASFALLDDDEFTLHRIEYDIGKIQEKMKEAGFTPYFYENLSKGSRIGGKIDSLEGLL